MGKLVFCYWKLRGLGEPAKMILEYANVDFEFKPIETQDQWNAEKFNLGLDFPNLPYVIDGDVKLTESWAIYKYLGKKTGLYPVNEAEERQSDILQGVIQDIRTFFAAMAYDPNFYKFADTLRKKNEPKFAMLEKYLGSRQFLLGDKVTYLDFPLYETLDHHRLFYGDIFENSPNIRCYMESFESLEPIAKYFESDRYKKFPINGSSATWGGKDYNDKK